MRNTSIIKVNIYIILIGICTKWFICASYKLQITITVLLLVY